MQFQYQQQAHMLDVGQQQQLLPPPPQQQQQQQMIRQAQAPLSWRQLPADATSCFAPSKTANPAETAAAGSSETQELSAAAATAQPERHKFDPPAAWCNSDDSALKKLCVQMGSGGLAGLED
jgi:hypothetical protein